MYYWPSLATEGFCLAALILKCFRIPYYLNMHPDLLILIANLLLKAFESVTLERKVFLFYTQVIN